MGKGMSRSASKKEREPVSGVGTVFMVIICGFISVNLLEMRDNKYYMSPECSKEDLPLVTIITPTYNSNPQYLKEAIESVLGQTYPKIEYIITDDGSSVFHEELIHELLETKNRGNVTWKIIRHDENVGTVKNLNGAIRESHGEYIFMMAHDDMYYDERVIEEWVEEFQRTGALVITGIKESFNDADNIVSISPKKETAKYLLHLSPRELNKLLLIDNLISGASTAYSRKCIIKYNLFDEQYKLLEDYPSYIEITHNGDSINFWARPVIMYRLVGISSGPRYRNIQQDIDNVTLFEKRVAYSSGINKLILILRNQQLLFEIRVILARIKSYRYDFRRLWVITYPGILLRILHVSLNRMVCNYKIRYKMKM